jgi:hypothetical protein
VKRLFLRALLFLAGAFSAMAQTATDPNEGSRVTYDNVNGICTLSWWGKTGTSYYIQFTEDLADSGSWLYYPVIVTGTDAVAGFNVETNATRFFMRLELTTNINADSDFDGMPDGWEVLNGLNPHFNDAGLDADGDDLTNLEEYLFGLDPQQDDLANGVRTQSYVYDDASRLTDVGVTLAETFVYDDEGNLTSGL